MSVSACHNSIINIDYYICLNYRRRSQLINFSVGVVGIFCLEATSYTRHGTFTTMLRRANPELRHTGMRQTETAPHWTCAVRERAIPGCAKLDLHHSGLRR